MLATITQPTDGEAVGGQTPSTIPVSVVIMTKNEENNIEKCLASVSRFSQAIVVDSDSSDLTREIATRMGAELESFHWDGKYPKKKQWCLQHLNFKCAWVLYVDADEEVTDSLVDEISTAIGNDTATAGYFIGFDYAFQGTLLRHGHRVYKLALFRVGSGHFVDYDDLDATNMWEVEGHYQPHVDGPVASLRNRMIHRDHDGLFHFFEKLNKYSDWEALLRRKGQLRSPEQSSRWGRRLMQRIGDNMPFRPLAIFIYSYIVRMGFLDGRSGFDFALALFIYHSMISMKVKEASLAHES